MKHFFCILLTISIVQITFAQSFQDTISIDAVTVYPKFQITQAGESSESFSLNTSQAIQYQNLGDFLSQETNIIIKQYGTEGMSSSISLRGAGSSRTQLLWNGIPLNSISSGDNNFSIVPTIGFSDVNIHHSTTNFGGAINLTHTPTFTTQKNIILSSSIGSFDTYKTDLQYELSNKRIDYSGSLFYVQSEGNFPYYDYIQLKNLHRTNADYKKYGTIQNLSAKITENITSQLTLWYQVNDANLPAIVGTTSSNIEHQIDSSFRILFSTKYYINSNNRLSYTTAYLHDFERYTQKISQQSSTYSTFSEIDNQSNYHILHYDTRWRHSTHFRTEYELQAKWQHADITSYGSPQTELSSTLIARQHYYFSKEHLLFRSTASIQKEINSLYTIPFIANIGSEVSILPLKNKLRFSIGNKYRTPTFNDLFWADWGNPNLTPESGWSSEIGINQHITRHSTFDASTYYSRINDMIMWTPQGSVWHPNNTAQAIIQGIECSFKTHIDSLSFKHHNEQQPQRKGRISFSQSIQYSFSNPYISKTYDSTETHESVGHILYYVPQHAFNYHVNIASKDFSHTLFSNWEFSFVVSFESSRYYTLTKQLDAYITLDAHVSKEISLNKQSLLFTFQARNLTNTIYEQVRSYPLPGRNFELALQWRVKR